MNEFREFERIIENEFSANAHGKHEVHDRESSDSDEREKDESEKDGGLDKEKNGDDKEHEHKKLAALKKAFIAVRGVAAIAAHRARSAGHHLKDLWEHSR